MNNKDLALLIAAIIFMIVALLHLLRLLFKTQITIAHFIVPMKTSLFGFIITLSLAIWMLLLSMNG